MPYYLLQAAYVPATMAHMVQSPQDRTHLMEGMVAKLGGKLEGLWLSFGDYDLVALCQMPDDMCMAAFSMAMSAGGAMKEIRTTSLLTWDEGVIAMKRANEVGYTPSKSSEK